jgi:tetratricopeptide (TPR) repeat protein
VIEQAEYARILGQCLAEVGRHEEAEDALRRCLEDLRRVSPDPPGDSRAEREKTIASVLATLGDCLLKQGRPDRAEPPLRECLDLREVHMRNEELHLNAMSLLGASLAGQGRYEEAEPLLVRAYEGMVEGAQWKSAALERLLALYEAWGKPEKATEWRGRPDGEDR